MVIKNRNVPLIVASIEGKRAEQNTLFDKLRKSIALAELMPDIWDSPDNQVSCHWLYRGERYNQALPSRGGSWVIVFPRPDKPNTTKLWTFVITVDLNNVRQRTVRYVYSSVPESLRLEEFAREKP